MRVGFDIRPALFSYAGIGRYARELARHLCALPDGPFLELFAPAWRGGAAIPQDLPPDRYKMHRGLLPARMMNQMARLPGLDAGRFPARVDVFHWTDYVYPPVRSAASVMTLHDAAFAVDPTFHGWNTSELMDRVRSAIQQADLVIVVSEPGRGDAELIGVDPEKVRVVPNGVSPFFKPGPRRKINDREYLLTVGTLEPRKNYMRILQALEVLWDRDRAPDWVIVGREGWEFAEFLDRMERSKHRRRIRWNQNASDDELLRLYQNATALVYPSLHEGFGLPVLEAMACGTPVIVGIRTAPAWVAGKGGMRVNPRKVDSIVEGVERILEEHHWRRQASAVLQMRAREFTWESAARKTLDVYRDAVAQRAMAVV